ncbi:MAG TPA: hypothetical protein VII49_13480 [Rhizomicrobium sp.]
MKQSAAYRGLKAAVILLGVLIVIALGILVVGLAVKLGGRGASRDTTPVFAPPSGAKLLSMETSEDRLILHVRSVSSDEIDIVDTRNGRLVARLAFAPAAR